MPGARVRHASPQAFSSSVTGDSAGDLADANLPDRCHRHRSVIPFVHLTPTTSPARAMNPHLHDYLIRAHTDELLRQAADARLVALARAQHPRRRDAIFRAFARRVRGASDLRRGPERSVHEEITIRYARSEDEAALGRLATLDSATVPALPLLVAEVDGELRAASSVSGSEVIADPFHPTVALVELLQIRAGQLGGPQAATANRGRSPRAMGMALKERSSEPATASSGGAPGC